LICFNLFLSFPLEDQSSSNKELFRKLTGSCYVQWGSKEFVAWVCTFCLGLVLSLPSGAKGNRGGFYLTPFA
jgi:hypothetical protein